jgi:Spy/CpxP family protein refolding chaperone
MVDQHAGNQEQKTHKIDTNVSTKEAIGNPSIGSVIVKHLNFVMQNRSMQALEADVDAWVKAEGEHTPEQRTAVLQQLKNAMGCLESIYSRVAQTY